MSNQNQHSGTLIEGLIDTVKAVEQRITCDYESPESYPGACDGGYPCYDKAIREVNGQTFCDRHALRAELHQSLGAL